LGKQEEFRWRKEYRVYKEDKLTAPPKEKILAQLKVN
jgi:hypothetical protein